MSERHSPLKQPTPSEQSHAVWQPADASPPPVPEPPDPPEPPEPALPPVEEPPVAEPPLPPVAEPPEPPDDEPALPAIVDDVVPAVPPVGVLEVSSLLHATHTNERESPITATYPGRMF